MAQFQEHFHHPPPPTIESHPKPPLLPKIEKKVVLSEDRAPALAATTTPKSTFVPYKSILTFMEPSPAKEQQTPEDRHGTNFEKRRKNLPKFPKSKMQGKVVSRLEVQKKKQKAALSRKKAQNNIVATVNLDDDSDGSDCVPVELPPPPLISIVSSDEEEFTKKRAMSPSSSSIISDDFIVAGDKRRVADPFKALENNKKKSVPVKITKIPSTSSSSSARSSCERATVQPVHDPSDNSNDDSIYGTKARPVKPAIKPAQPETDSSDDEMPCVNEKNLKRRSNKSKSDPESDKEEISASTPLAKIRKRSRFITPSYTEDEFATMISSILSGGAIAEESEESNSALEPVKLAPPPEHVKSPEPDCQIIEQPVEVVSVPDDDDQPILSDSDDSTRAVELPKDCDISLNVTQIPFEPHEHLWDADNYTSVDEKIVGQVDPEIGWNDEMRFFYNHNWGGKHFNMTNIYDGMSTDPKLWRINNADRNRTPDSGSKIRCRKCNEVGHIAVKCNKPRKRIVCFMCGEEGHRETRCPNSICLRVS